MISIFWNMMKGFWVLFKYPLYFIVCCFLVFFLLVCINIVIGFAKGKRFNKGEHNVVKKKSMFRRIFIEAPHQFVEDLFEKEGDFFGYQGLIIFEGRQGSGKTISMIEYAMRINLFN